MTLAALQPRQSMELDSGVNVVVIQTIPPGFIIHLTTRPPDKVTVPSVIGADSGTARGAIQVAGLVANFVGPLTNSEVVSQSPEGGDVVPRGSVVTLQMPAILLFLGSDPLKADSLSCRATREMHFGIPLF
jgi:hypothetical protein